MQLNKQQKEQIKYMLANNRAFAGIERVKKPINMEYSMAVLKEIGRTKCPKFKIDNDNEFMFKNLLYWLHGSEKCTAMNPKTMEFVKGDLDKGFYIFGNTGTGKSVALDIIKAYANIMQLKINVDIEEKNLYWENLRTTDICSSFSNKGTYENCIKPKVIGLQDLGSEERETLYMGNRINVIQQILETRGDANDNITFITSNLPMDFDTMSKRYNDRVASRLQEMCNFYVLGGKDRRLKN